MRLWDALGSHVGTIDGVEGVSFAVWAPNARRVSVVGDFNEWDARRDPLQASETDGVWRAFVAHAEPGARYKYAIESRHGVSLPLKSDPLARYAESTPGYASIVWRSSAASWRDERWMQQRGARNSADAPISIYEVHLGSWRRLPGERVTYREAAESLLPYIREMGFTHVELLPVAEHPFTGSWGYQPTSMFAPSSRYGTPDDLRAFVERAHDLDLAVIFDWVPGHFPDDPHGLASFDGTPLYEHGDPRRGIAPEWNTLVYDYGRPEVAAFLTASALYWLEEFHADGLRVDAVASMLYLDYARRPGEWLPNVHGGNENLEAIAFLRGVNEAISQRCPGAATFAEESTIRPLATAPIAAGGLGFSYKWNMGWMQDTLGYLTAAFAERSEGIATLTKTQSYAFGEKYVLPLSHDEVVHGKRSVLQKMAGDESQRFAGVRLLIGLMFAHPGKKLLFMGTELGATLEWNHDEQLEWDILADPRNAGIQRLVRDCNALYRTAPALHRLDADESGFAWLDVEDPSSGVFAFARTADDGSGHVIAAVNSTPDTRRDRRIGVLSAGTHRVAIDTDAVVYGGDGIRTKVTIDTENLGTDGREPSLVLTLPPLSVLMLQAE